jgi:phage terminase small subunit
MADAKRRHDWWLASSLMALHAEINRDRKRRSRPFKPEEFNPMIRRTSRPLPINVTQLASLLGLAPQAPHRSE